MLRENDPAEAPPPRSDWASLTPLLGPALFSLYRLCKWLVGYRDEHPPKVGRSR